MSHTPGPWSWTRLPDQDYASVWLPTTYEYEIFADTSDEAIANASLIAAAPELLKACRLALDKLNLVETHSSGYVIIELSAAIAKAEGKQ